MNIQFQTMIEEAIRASTATHQIVELFPNSPEEREALINLLISRGGDSKGSYCHSCGIYERWNWDWWVQVVGPDPFGGFFQRNTLTLIKAVKSVIQTLAGLLRV